MTSRRVSNLLNAHAFTGNQDNLQPQELAGSTREPIFKSVTRTSRKKSPRTLRTTQDPESESSLFSEIEKWFDEQGRQPFRFQREVWQAMCAGKSGLLHAGTGSGKTLACWLGALLACEQNEKRHKSGLKVLWITPMRALAQDSLRALQTSAQPLCPDWTIQTRTGDTQASVRAKQARTWPDALITTPESLSLMLTHADASKRLAHLQVVIVDEWHELLGSKRGVQVQLALARLARWNPGLLIWAMSATLGNLQHALQALMPACRSDSEPVTSLNRVACGRTDPCLISAPASAPPVIDVVLPKPLPRYAWAGQMGYAMATILAQRIECAGSSLVFVNTRTQAERWYQAILQARPSLAGLIALHHGSLDSSVRQWVEQGIREGGLKAIVCTSSLDLGVDFTTVEQVFQIGSCKGVARLLQRAGRSGHSPGGQPRIGLVPTHALEALEAVAVYDAVASQAIEARESPVAPMDVLVQHLVTVGLGGGFEPQDLYHEIRQAWAYRNLDRHAWTWALAFVTTGGESLGAYPDYQRVVRGDQKYRSIAAGARQAATSESIELVNPVSSVTLPEPGSDGDACWRVLDRRLALRHRLNIGTIVSDAMMQVRYWTRRAAGAALGQIEEGFVSRIKPGECFVFGGRVLELVRVHDMTVYVRRAQASRAAMPRWEGGNMPLSGELTRAMVNRLNRYQNGLDTLASASLESSPSSPMPQLPLPGDDSRDGDGQAGAHGEGRYAVYSPELAWQALSPLLAEQQAMSGLPTHDRLLIEQMHSRDGSHWFIYPMAGRRVHLALASLLAWRLAQKAPRTFSLSVNDYGLELLCNQPLDASEHLTPDLFDETDLQADLQASVNAAELAQRRFREIARIAGLVYQGFPSQKKSARQIQASSQLFYKVFEKYDPENHLLLQASREVLMQEFDLSRLSTVLQRIRAQALDIRVVRKATPFGFGLVVQRLGQRLSSEKLVDRVTRMLREVGALEEIESAPLLADVANTKGSKSAVRRPSRRK